MSITPVQSKYESIKSTSAPSEWWALFGPPLLLPDEDPAAYDALRARICAAVKPLDIIDVMFMNDFICLEWEILRWRRLKSALLNDSGFKALRDYLVRIIDLNAEELTQVLVKEVGEDQREEFARLAELWAQHQPDACEQITELLCTYEIELDDFKADKGMTLADRYRRREPGAIEEVNALCEKYGSSVECLIAECLSANLDSAERIDRLTAIAENRRNASLREFERHHALLGADLRRGVQEIEDAEFKVSETTPTNGRSPT